MILFKEWTYNIFNQKVTMCVTAGILTHLERTNVSTEPLECPSLLTHSGHAISKTQVVFSFLMSESFH